MHNQYAPDKDRSDTRIVVAMSGGVDSSTVAAMMVEEGYNVIGMTLQLYDYSQHSESNQKTVPNKGACCAGQDINDAAMVCSKLDIPHYVLNYESLFKESVMDDFADSYMNGITPVPCVKCNQTVKFVDMLKAAKDMDADALVTGHYVKKVIGSEGVELHKGEDDNKDQSYFLFATTKEQLEYLSFPLGGYTKQQTRELAEKFDLEVANKPDSQDICFVPNGNYSKIVEKLRPGALDAGDIIHVDGTILGRHEGIIKYTRGQRRGLGVSSENPLYVIRVNPEENQVIVGDEKDLYSDSFTIENINWLADEQHKEMNLSMKLRSAHKGTTGTLKFQEDGKAIVQLDNEERAITPGQACVFYDNDRVLGGGWIAKDF